MEIVLSVDSLNERLRFEFSLGKVSESSSPVTSGACTDTENKLLSGAAPCSLTHARGHGS